MEITEIKSLAIELMDAVRERKLSEFSLDTEEFCVSIKMQGETSTVQIAPPTATVAVSETPVTTAPPAEVPSGTRVEAPIVGIFYASASPDAPPFVEVGQKVKKGDTLCVIEAMKTMNEIVAPCDGVINRIFAQNGEMVEYNQLICTIA